MERTLEIYYTADVTTPDGSDTSPMGDGTEEGHGATMENGWINPARSYVTVWENHTQVTPEVFAPDPDLDDAEDLHPVHWLVSTLTGYDRLYEVEVDGVTWREDGTTFYSRYDREVDFEANQFGSPHVSMAAHVHGFTEDEIKQAIELMSPPLLDNRYRVGLEFTGDYQDRANLLPGQMWVARFAGEWIGSAATEIDAHRLAVAHHREHYARIASI